MNTSRKFLKIDKNIQWLMLVTQLVLAVIGFSAQIGYAIVWVPVITFFLGVYQWGISGMIHISGAKYTAGPVKKWRKRHLVGSGIYLILAFVVTTINPNRWTYLVGMIAIPQMIGYAYYALTVWDYRLYQAYENHLEF